MDYDNYIHNNNIIIKLFHVLHCDGVWVLMHILIYLSNCHDFLRQTFLLTSNIAYF